MLVEVMLRDEWSFAVLSFSACALRACEIGGGVGLSAARGGQPVSPLRRPAGRLDVAAILLGVPEAFLRLALPCVRVELGSELLGAAGGEHGGKSRDRVAGRLDRRELRVRRLGLFGEIEMVGRAAAGESRVREFLAQAGVGE